MSVTNLTHPVFESDLRSVLQLPTFRPVSLFHITYVTRTLPDLLLQEALTAEAASKAMAFPQGDSKALKAYGVPTNVLVDVSMR